MTSKSDGQSNRMRGFALLFEDFEKWGSFESGEALASEIVDGLLWILHSRHIIGERGLLVGVLGSIETQEFSQYVAILAIFVDTELEIL
jgi:hypothetical protein